jgi:hypothetical protein
MNDNRTFQVSKTKNNRVVMEFLMKCSECDTPLMHRMELDVMQTSQLAVDLMMKLGVAEDLQRAFTDLLGKDASIESYLATKH